MDKYQMNKNKQVVVNLSSSLVAFVVSLLKH